MPAKRKGFYISYQIGNFMTEVPSFAMRAYALFLAQHGTAGKFGQQDLAWIVSGPMRKKIFSVLLRAGWIAKTSRAAYRCVDPQKIFKEMLEFRVPDVINKAGRPYAFTGMSAIEIWSDYSYVQRSIAKSPYFIKVLKRDVRYWKQFFNKNSIPNYVAQGTTIGEYVILVPVTHLRFVEKGGIKTEPLQETERQASQNELYEYAYEYMRRKYGASA